MTSFQHNTGFRSRPTSAAYQKAASGEFRQRGRLRVSTARSLLGQASRRVAFACPLPVRIRPREAQQTRRDVAGCEDRKRAIRCRRMCLVAATHANGCEHQWQRGELTVPAGKTRLRYPSGIFRVARWILLRGEVAAAPVAGAGEGRDDNHRFSTSKGASVPGAGCRWTGRRTFGAVFATTTIECSVTHLE